MAHLNLCQLQRCTSVESEQFLVSTYHELLAIHKVMLEARFSDQPFDTELSGNPVAASLHERVITALRDIDRQNDNDEADAAWNQWLTISSDRREWSIALDRAQRESRWDGWEEMERRFYVLTLLSPFDVSEALLAEFVCKVQIERARRTSASAND